MKILFLDQTGKLAGAEQVLLDVAYPYRHTSLVALFEGGPFEQALRDRNIPVEVLTDDPLDVRRESSLWQGLSSLKQLTPLVQRVVQLSQHYDIIYANTPKAMVVGALAHLLTHTPLVYHLHDILSLEHFSQANRQLLVTLANRCATRIIAVSHATKKAFVEAGGKGDRVDVIYNGFDVDKFRGWELEGFFLRRQLNLDHQFVVGHFSRLSPWKGQHVLIEALPRCPQNMVVLLVGDALFGETDYAERLRRQVTALKLEDRVHFLGFRGDVPQLMATCDLITHTSTAPEPSARVLIESMLSGRPLVASHTGGTSELVDDGYTGWLVPPADAGALASTLTQLHDRPVQTAQIAKQGQQVAQARFGLDGAISALQLILNTLAPDRRQTTEVGSRKSEVRI
ncbi:MAG: glycosyltransferase family 4 protein [Cyanobacteria bacterium J06633_23]